MMQDEFQRKGPNLLKVLTPLMRPQPPIWPKILLLQTYKIINQYPTPSPLDHCYYYKSKLTTDRLVLYWVLNLNTYTLFDTKGVNQSKKLTDTLVLYPGCWIVQLYSDTKGVNQSKKLTDRLVLYPECWIVQLYSDTRRGNQQEIKQPVGSLNSVICYTLRSWPGQRSVANRWMLV